MPCTTGSVASSPSTTERRSANMRAIRGRDTKPELTVRSMVHRLGYRFRLHRTDLPGTPDIVFPSRHAVIFVHGCFWHAHSCRRGQSRPTSNAQFWATKIEGNATRDAAVLDQLAAVGWNTLVVWECELRDASTLATRIQAFLN